MSNGIQLAPRDVWLLFDISNGHVGVKNYMWWFETRTKARAHQRKQNSNPNYARLVGPYHYRVISKDSTKLEFHEYDCKFWRIGKSHGPCTCRKLRRKNGNR